MEMNNSYDSNNRCREWVRSRNEECGGPGHYLDPTTGVVACQRHSKLLVDPIRLLVNTDEIERAAKVNRKNGLSGDVIMGRIVNYYTRVDYTSGYLAVYPNDSRPPAGSEGLWLPGLSPKRLGPVVSREPGVPDATSIEALHQASRVFEHERDEDGSLLPSWYADRDEYLTDPARATWRHKFGATKPDHLAYLKSIGASDHKTKSIHIGSNGEEVSLNYVQNRWWYCSAYEELVPQTEDFETLESLIDNGTNVEMFGYDALHGMEPGQEFEWYSDETKRFGHESVLYCILTMDPADYPWNVYADMHPEIYGRWMR